MTQEDKELLLKDLCGRLSYGVILQVPTYINGGIEILDTLIVSNGWINASYDIDEVKPYLRPMSSMTEEEKKEVFACISSKGWAVSAGQEIDWLNKNMFDYRGLIPMGLALEAKEGMYKID